MGVKFSQLPTIEFDQITNEDYIALLDTSEGLVKKAAFEIPLSVKKGGTGNTYGYVRAGLLNGVVPGSSSTSEGTATTSTGIASHAEGIATSAMNDGAHSEGTNTVASGSSSHAEGEGNKAIGDNSHAGGYCNIANFDSEAVFGTFNDYQTSADDPVLFAVGNGTDETHRKNALVVKQTGVVETVGDVRIGGDLYINESSDPIQLNSVIPNPEGSPTHDLLSVQIGESIYAVSNGGGGGMPSDPLSIGHGGTGNSYGYIRTGQTSTSPAGTNATAEGMGNDAKGKNSHAEGLGNTANNPNSHAEGEYCRSAGDGAHSEGRNAKAEGDYSHAECYNTTASGNYSHAEGSGTNVSSSAIASHAEGFETVAEASYSHVEGYQTTTTGEESQGAHAEGVRSTASGEAAHAEGYGSNASGNYSHAQGYYTNAKGRISYSGGQYTETANSSECSFVFGKGQSTSNRLVTTHKGSLVFSDASTNKFTGSIPCPGTAFGTVFSNIDLTPGSSYAATYGLSGTASPPVSQPIQLTDLAYGGIYMLTCTVYATSNVSNRGSVLGGASFMVYCRLNNSSGAHGKVLKMTETFAPGHNLSAPNLDGDTLVIDYTSSVSILALQVNLVRFA